MNANCARFEKAVMLMVLDNTWKDHLANMDFLRQGIHLRGYAQKNPKQEYKRESYEMFSEMLLNVRQEVIRLLFRLQIKPTEDVNSITQKTGTARAKDELHPYGVGVSPGKQCAAATAAGGEDLRAGRSQDRTQRTLSLRFGARSTNSVVAGAA